MKLIKVKMLRTLISPDGCYMRGRIYEIDPKWAKALAQGGGCKLIEPPKTTAKTQRKES